MFLIVFLDFPPELERKVNDLRRPRECRVRSGEDIAVTTLNLVYAPDPERRGRKFRILDAPAGPESRTA